MKQRNKDTQPEILLACEESPEQRYRTEHPRPYDKPWVQMNQRERNEQIEMFEDAMLAAYGHFPKPNWMKS